MASDPTVWRVRSPGDLSVEMPEVSAGDVQAAVERSKRAFGKWRRLGLDDRKAVLSLCHDRLKAKQEDLARLIAMEVGKPLREARLELAAVVAKFDFTFSDADRFLADQDIADGPYPAMVRRRARGPAAVVAPFNFPIHLGHGAAVAYLLAGNTVLFKPSPLAANVGAAYACGDAGILAGGCLRVGSGMGDDRERRLYSSGGKIRLLYRVHSGRKSPCPGTGSGLFEITRAGTRRKERADRFLRR